ncbi:Scr1 family TA system antitoxin-like transcriptional regulator [Nocardiopsis nanhaiensis]
MTTAVTPGLSQLLLESQTALSADETDAAIDSFSPAVVPGALQMSAYARAGLAACGVREEDALEQAVRVRLERGHRVRAHPRQHRYLMTESALYAPWLGLGQQQEQRRFLVECAQHLRVRVLSGESPVPWTGAFEFLTYADGTSVVNLETPAGRLVTPKEMVCAYQHHFQELFEAAADLPHTLASTGKGAERGDAAQ